MTNWTRLLCVFAFLAVWAIGVVAQARIASGQGDVGPAKKLGAQSSREGPAPMFLQVEPVVPKDSYGPGEPITFSLVFRNLTDQPLTLHEFPPEIDIVGRFAREPVYTIPAGTEELILPARGEATRSFAWDRAGQQVAPGHYDFSIERIHVGQRMMSWNGWPGSPPNQAILVQDPAGELVGTLTSGAQSVAGGVAIILETATFNPRTTTIEARVIPPGYDFPEGSEDRPVMPPMWIMPFNPTATFAVDGGSARSMSCGFNPRQHDVELQCTGDPVAANARSFHLAFATLGKWDGPWTFSLDLATDH